MPPDASGDTSDAAEDPGDAADSGEVDTSRPDPQTAQQWCDVFRSAGRPEGMCPDGQCAPPREGCLADVRFVAAAYAAAVHVSQGAGESLPHSWAIPDLPEDESHRWGRIDSEHFACLDAGVLVVDASTCEVALHGVAGEALWTLDVGAIDREVLDGSGPHAGTRVTVTSHSARVDADASILGCGENTGPLDRRGTRVQYFNTDAYNSDYGGWAPDAPLLYASIPFCTFLSDDAA